tara:strand:- start:951 stop:1385 length:435 start_codon:yes stop_codon:yes gene_type:complete
MKKTLYSQAEMEKEASSFLHNLTEKEGATVLALKGDLGAGKTTFTQSLAKALNIQQALTSPTFVIQKSYTIPNHPFFNTLIHIDAYRLESADELFHLGFKELLSDNKNLICVEWPEKVPEAIPQDATTLLFSFINDTTREIDYA